MKFILFPEPFLSQTKHRAQARYRDSMRERRTERVGDSVIVKDCAAYRLPCGTLRPVYDPYRPEYPEGAEPGLADVRRTFHWYPNDTGGYTFHPFNFRPLATLTEGVPA